MGGLVVLFFGILLVTVILATRLDEYFFRFFRWLKGSRFTYYQQYRGHGIEIHSTSSELRTDAQRRWAGSICDGGVIEINRGFFRRRSAIYNLNNTYWRISKSWHCIDGDGCDYVSITDSHGLRASTSLQMINKYSSLQAMLDRIAELEKELVIAKSRQEELLAGACAVLLEITTDRQRYRSPAAMRVRKCLEAMTAWAEQGDVPFPQADKIMSWKRRFPNRNENIIKQ